VYVIFLKVAATFAIIFVLYATCINGNYKRNGKRRQFQPDEGEDIKEDAQEIDGRKYRSRTECYIRDQAEEPDPAKWQTDVSILLADE